MYALKNIFSSLIDKVKLNQEKKPIYTEVNGGINGTINQTNVNTNRDYATFDQEVITRTNYLLQNKS
jgi:hypothetical protein